MSDMPDVLSVSLTGGEWAAYQCRSGRGGKNETVYIKEALAEEKAEAELQEKLRQQREACAEVYYHLTDADSWQQNTIKYAILNAEIDNNGEEG